MRIASALASGEFGRRRLLAFGTLVVGAIAAYEFAQYVINDDMTGLAYVALCIAGGAVVVAILHNWRNGVYFFLSWLLFEDFVRKFLGNNMAIYFGKDLLVLVVYISFFMAVRRKEVTIFRPPFLVPLLMFIWFGAMQVFNPASTSLGYGLMGFKIFFYYVPLVFVGYALLNSEAELRRFFTTNMVLVLVIVSLGVAQSIIGPGFLNPAVQAEDLRLLSGLYRVSASGGAVAYRPTSVFVSAGRYADFIMVAWILVLGFSGYLLLRHKKGRILAFVAIPITAAGAFLTASRGSFMWGMINAAATSIAFVWRRSMAPRGSVASVPLDSACCDRHRTAEWFCSFTFMQMPSVAACDLRRKCYCRWSDLNGLTHRGSTYPLANFVGAFSYDRWPYGYGIRTTALGGRYVARFLA